VTLYDVIYADPPWRYSFSRSRTRAIDNHYPTMPLENIKALQVPAADDAVLFNGQQTTGANGQPRSEGTLGRSGSGKRFHHRIRTGIMP
jgi:hypothetical protein